MLGVLERPVQLLHERDRLQVVEVHLPVACDERGTMSQRPSEDLQSGKLLALEELEAGAAARRDVTELVVGEAELAHGRGRVAAADDAESVDLGERLRDRLGARRERRRSRTRPSGRSRTPSSMPRMTSANCAAVSGPMSSPRPEAPNGVSSMRVGRGDDVLGVRRERSPRRRRRSGARARRRAPWPSSR